MTLKGRKNWNIPKHLARFEFSAPSTQKDHSPPASLTVKVYPPLSPSSAGGEAEKPFFEAMLTPWKYVPPFPLSTGWLPLSTLVVQPPLPSASGLDSGLSSGLGSGVDAGSGSRSGPTLLEKAEEVKLLCGTETWKSFEIGASTRKARMMSVRVESEPQSKWWPDVTPWSFGVWLENATLVIPVPEEF